MEGGFEEEGWRDGRVERVGTLAVSAKLSQDGSRTDNGRHLPYWTLHRRGLFAVNQEARSQRFWKPGGAAHSVRIDFDGDGRRYFVA